METLETDKTYTYIKEVEELGQEIINTREQKLELSNVENKLREAFRALDKCNESKSWLKVGCVYIQKPTGECKKKIREEINKVKDELEELQKKLRTNVHKLRDLEHQPGIEGYGLKPISAAEAKTLHKAFNI